MKAELEEYIQELKSDVLNMESYLKQYHSEETKTKVMVLKQVILNLKSISKTKQP